MTNKNHTLPDLPSRGAVEADTVLAAGLIYAAFELENAGLFAVADRIAALCEKGMLRVRGSSVGRAVAEYVADRSVRSTEAERRLMYCRVLGLRGGGGGEPRVNRDFESLWTRFLSSVTALERERTAVTQEAVRKAGRDLAANLSLYGWGGAQVAATRLQAQIAAALKLLSYAEIREAFGARDTWEVIDTVAARELGGARQGARYRTLASSGLAVIKWIAAAARDRAASPSTDDDLVDACERWLAASALPDEKVSEASQPPRSHDRCDDKGSKSDRSASL